MERPRSLVGPWILASAGFVCGLAALFGASENGAKLAALSRRADALDTKIRGEILGSSERRASLQRQVNELRDAIREAAPK